MSDLPGYTVEGLEHGIERCKINIDALEKAIDTERKTIKDYRFMIDEIARAGREKAAADAGMTIAAERINIEVDDDGAD